MRVSRYKGTDKPGSHARPVLKLSVLEILEDGKKVVVETAQHKEKLILVHETNEYVLRKFGLFGNIAGKVFNSWELAFGDEELPL